ncbi:MAG: hypothetical protein LBM95_05045 [Lactobacillales bacterium]|nr:hypothetical protein [Lactobacillales bacterium]
MEEVNYRKKYRILSQKIKRYLIKQEKKRKQELILYSIILVVAVILAFLGGIFFEKKHIQADGNEPIVTIKETSSDKKEAATSTAKKVATSSSPKTKESSIKSDIKVDENTTSSTTESQITTNPNEKFPDKEIGGGTLNLSTESGNTKTSKEVILTVLPDSNVEQIGYEVEKFDGSKKSYIYVDGTFNMIEILENRRGTLSLNETIFGKEGKHTVQIVQYDNNKEDGKIVTYKTKDFFVKK